MKKLLARLLIFFVGIPAVVCLIVLLPQHNHLALNIAVILVSAGSGAELARMFKKKGFPAFPLEAAVLGALSPLSMMLSVSFGISEQLTPAFFVVGTSWLLVSGIFFHIDGDFQNVLHRLAAGFSVMLYPGHFLGWAVRMSLFKHSTAIILIFILTVMANDSLAWATGMLFGNGNRGLFKVSPNKSIAGFIGGLLSSVAVCVAAAYLFPEVFAPDQIPRLPSALIMGFLSGAAVILGDLAESALKRCCDVKDSGGFIPGRGGILDSVDSVAFTAPVFFILYRFFF